MKKVVKISPTITKYDFHDIANIYPLAKEEEFELLKESIKDRGQLSPIVIFDKKIIDGRNRYLACKDVGVEPIIETFTGTEDEALKYAIELNSGRRHMSKQQAAMMAASHVLKSRTGTGKKVTIPDAVKMFLVSPKYITRAKSIKEKNDEMAQEILDGKLTIGQAENKLYEIENHEREIDLLKSGSTTSEEDFGSVGESKRYKEIQVLSMDELRKRLLLCEKSKKFN